MVAALARLAARAREHHETAITGRSHNVPAQVTTLGKRFANAGEEILVALDRLDDLVARYPLRGIKGPVGTQQDQLSLLGDDAVRVEELERAVARHLGFDVVLGSVGQVYPRSLDLNVVSALLQATSGPSSLATSIRLMAGHELVTEGFAEGQVGSSAMPHKMNTRSCERISGLHAVLRGHVTMVSAAGDQWNEGDVSCSVVRRVAIPDAFYTADGVYQNPVVGARRVRRLRRRHRPRASPGAPRAGHHRILAAVVDAGLGPEEAHRLIGAHALAAATARRQGDETGADLLARLAADPVVPLDRPQLGALVADPLAFAGTAPARCGRSSSGWRRSWPRTPRLPAPTIPDALRRTAVTAAIALPHQHSGKVRDIYEVDDEHLLMVTSDRISAFDVVMDEEIPHKGRVLTAMCVLVLGAR